ncbi:hypothetical protein MHC_02525 [Mycoplasma haemocanis str. Illinois]|uniref:DUF31 domain-containing protein n=1 Tax=Mycoplasma haemocanis (strain Illinois) TaxID=1111676 RepID=H6N6U7_MYCHN|nr:hypothetical protein [Mycoplasma haemocanis]AEW45369.1 hypothetical protein MHC_02525 [Mycoplasma haemocanis str. Illinois]
MKIGNTLLTYNPVIHPKISLLLAAAGGATVNGIYYTFNRDYFLPITGNFYSPKSLVKVSSDFHNNTEKNNLFNTRFDESKLRHRSASGAEKILQKIKDYTFRIVTPCGSGTAWILDYAIPTGNAKYPTKWYIATNAHVISKYRFLSNEYKQILPISLEDTQYRRKHYGNKPLSWEILNSSACELSQKYGFSEMLLYKEVSQENLVYYKQFKNPKLFYVPINFLGSRYSSNGRTWKYDNYYKDFAVIEIDINSEENAQKLTDNFYGKYAPEKEKKEILNIFDKELMFKGDSSFGDNYYISGYPAKADGEDLRISSNWDPSSKKGANLISGGSKYHLLSIQNKWGEPIAGHIDVRKIDWHFQNTATIWNGKPHYDWGYNYLLDNTKMGGGASGSLVSDEEGNILGLYRMRDVTEKWGFVEPLRSEGVYINSRIIVPKYDLIKGVIGQVSSYRQQLEKFHPNMETFLSKRNWN